MADDDNKVVVIRKIDRIDYILSGLCDYWKIDIQELTSYRRDPAKVNRKRIAILLLHDVADCLLKDIVNVLYYKKGSNQYVCQELGKIRDYLSEDTYGNTELKLEYNRIIKHLKL